MPIQNREQEPKTKQFLSAALVLSMMTVPNTRHVPRCGRTWHFELPSVSETDAMQTHEESTALKTLPHASANWHGDCDPTQVIEVCSSANGRS